MRIRLASSPLEESKPPVNSWERDQLPPSYTERTHFLINKGFAYAPKLLPYVSLEELTVLFGPLDVVKSIEMSGEENPDMIIEQGVVTVDGVTYEEHRSTDLYDGKLECISTLDINGVPDALSMVLMEDATTAHIKLRRGIGSDEMQIDIPRMFTEDSSPEPQPPVELPIA
ncbi:MAG: hypothetical protein R3B92_04465 [Patescibacteria group bacterium]